MKMPCGAESGVTRQKGSFDSADGSLFANHPLRSAQDDNYEKS